MNESVKRLLETRDKLSDVYDTDRARIERLRLILEEEQGRPFTFTEAQEIGAQLTSLFRSLAAGRIVTKGGLKNKNRLIS